jgi:integrase
VTRRAAHGQGTVYFDSDRGRWVGQASAGVNPGTGKRRRLKVVGGPGESRKSVAGRLSDRIAEVGLKDSGPTTVGQLVEDWLVRAAPTRKSSGWLSTSRQLVESHVLPVLGSVPLSEVTVEQVETWMVAMSARLSRSTVVKVRSQLALAFDYGVRRRLVDWNPARIAELPAATAPPRQGRALTRTEARALLNVAADHRLGAWVTTAITLGLRPGEVSGLSWPDIDLEDGILVVHRSLAWDVNTAYLKGTKTGKVRTLDLPPRTHDALRDHRKRQVEERLLLGDRWPVAWSDLVFVSEAGTPLIPSNLRRLIATLAAHAGIAGKLTPYDLRHSATSLLSASGVAPETLADLLGHVDTRMVHHHYRHPVTPSIRVAREHIEEALNL